MDSLSEFKTVGFKPRLFGFAQNLGEILSALAEETKDLLDAIRAEAKMRGMPYQTLIKERLRGVFLPDHDAMGLMSIAELQSVVQELAQKFDIPLTHGDQASKKKQA